MLVDHDADIESLDAAGRTPLHAAAFYGRSLMVKVSHRLRRLLLRRKVLYQILVEAGASKTAVDKDVLTPLDLVCKHKDAKCSEKVEAAIVKLLSS